MAILYVTSAITIGSPVSNIPWDVITVTNGSGISYNTGNVKISFYVKID